nr:immunoglobulin heavy chain junction region [Macaca mulatta]MOW19763.1 immunoglobulin heavy chain junction region [Macaca mulatta]MOW19965.1 immunoglobulin heavy chain junction region [Macaca mulatta]MOW20126.1 immunoglobulin heavy chain junction region [Macaca mulatta]MOW20358.1 immunoglobulin heavy chain junction region [Macaca mulatta]
CASGLERPVPWWSTSLHIW